MPDKPDTQAKPRARRKTRTPEETARSYFDAIAARDADAMAAHWHAEGIDDIVPIGVFRGPDEVREQFRETFAAVPDLEMLVEDVIVDGRRVAVRWRLTGTFTGAPFQGIEPNGRRIELRGCDCLEVERGKIVRNTAYFDQAAFARSIGMLPARDSGAERAMVTAFNAVTKGRALVRDRLGSR